MAASPLNTIKNWFKTGLKPTQAQFWATWDSFWHKDDGSLVTGIAAHGDDIVITTTDGAGNATETTIGQYQEPDSFEIDKISGLQAALDNLVVKIGGKGLSTEDFTSELKTKLETLQNYVHPEKHTIGEVDGLNDILDAIASDLNALAGAIAGISHNNFLIWRGYRLYKIPGNVETYPEAGEELKGRGDGSLFGGEIIHVTAKYDLPEEEDDLGEIDYAVDADFNFLSSYP